MPRGSSAFICTLCAHRCSLLLLNKHDGELLEGARSLATCPPSMRRKTCDNVDVMLCACEHWSPYHRYPERKRSTFCGGRAGWTAQRQFF